MTLIPKEYAIADPTISVAMGLDAVEHGLLFCLDAEGERWTAVTDDPDFVRLLRDASPEVRAGLEIGAEKFPLRRRR